MGSSRRILPRGLTQRVAVDGVEYGLDDLTVEESETIGRLPAMRQWAAIVTTFLTRTIGEEAAAERVRSMRVLDIFDCFFEGEDDFPGTWINGMPKRGRSGDALVVWAARQHNWPPDVTRRQTLRDLALVQQSYEGEAHVDD